jgi:hypothetical protein
MNRHERYAIYHANDLHAMIAPQPERWYTDPSRHYTHVADVEAPLAQVFALTNHIDHPWTDNPEVVWHTASPVRSTSVGDVIVSLQSRRVWLVMPAGLQELAPDNARQIGNGEANGTLPSPNEGKEGLA